MKEWKLRTCKGNSAVHQDVSGLSSPNIHSQGRVTHCEDTAFVGRASCLLLVQEGGTAGLLLNIPQFGLATFQWTSHELLSTACLYIHPKAWFGCTTCGKEGHRCLDETPPPSTVPQPFFCSVVVLHIHILHARPSHAEVEHPAIQVILNFVIQQQFADEVFDVRSYELQSVLCEISTLQQKAGTTRVR